MKKFISMMLLLMILFAFNAAGCSPAPAPEPTATEVPTEVPTEEPAPTSEPTLEPTATEEPTPEPIVVVDGLGEELVLDEPARAIVSISPSLTESLFAVGAGERIVGRDSNSNYPEAAQGIPDLGNMYGGLPVEDIVALEPDLVVAAEIIPPDQIQELRDLGLNVYWQANPDDFQGLYQNLREVARLVGTLDQAEALIGELSGRVDAVDAALDEAGSEPLVFYELDATDPANPYTVGEGTFISYVINKARARNLGDALEGSFIQISSEEILVQDPEIILLADALYGITPESVAERPGWGEITAVQEGQVYPFDPFLLSVPGPRLVDGFEEISYLIHPELEGN